MPRRRDERARVLGPYFIETTGYYRVTTVDPAANGGRGRRADRHFRGLEEAEDWKQVVQAKLARLHGFTIENAITEYEKHLAQTIAESSWKERGKRLRQFFAGTTTMQLARLRPDRAAQQYAAFREGRSVDTHRNVLGNAKGFFAWCVEQGWAAESPLVGVKGIGRRKVGKPQLTGDEARKFDVTALRMAEQGDEGALGAEMLLLMGLRQSEVYKRRVRDLDLDGTVLRIEGAKTAKGNRARDVPPALRPLLLELVEGRSPFDFLFTNQDGSPHTRAWLLAAVKRVCLAAGVPVVCPHGLRGTHSSISHGEGNTSRSVADALGHVDERTTLRHYTDASAVENGMQVRALKVLAGGKR